MKLSLQKKLLIILIGLPTIAASLYSVVAIDLFKSDKQAYVYESNSSISRSLAQQVKNEIDSHINSVRSITVGLNPKTSTFSQWAKKLFHSNRNLSHIAIVDLIEKKSIATLSKLSEVDKESLDFAQIENGTFKVFGENQLLFTISNDFLKKKNLVVVTVVSSKNIENSFTAPSPSANYLITRSGKMLFGSLGNDYSFEKWDLSKTINFDLSSTTDFLSPQSEKLLISNSPVSYSDLHVVSIIETSKAFKAASELIIQSIIFLISIVAASVLISFVASKGLTSKLKRLLGATKEIAKGNYAIAPLPASNDEIGILSSSFSTMATEIEQLMLDNIEKSRMETELKTAQTVQKTLFPAEEADLGKIALSGFYEPASECGGDWWHYSDLGEKIVLWIGDATGHGAPAALITSAAKATSTIIEMRNIVSPAEIMGTLNHAIHGAAQGEICMTFFVATIDKATNEMVYCNASHEAPIIIPNTESLSRMDFSFLQDNNSPRIGENPKSTYSESSYQIKPQEHIFFYTDGITELYNPTGKMYGERKLAKALVGAHNMKSSLKAFKDFVLKDLYEFRDGEPLQDDVTFFVIKSEEKA